MFHTVYLSLGTNLADRLANLAAARQALGGAVQVSAVSSVYETMPWGYQDQPAFLNQVLAGTTRLTPQELLKEVKAIETRLGRQATFRYGPRLIDIDILFYDDLVLDQPGLRIPHPRLQERAFVLIPLLEIAPGLVHSRLNQTITQLAAGLDASGIRRLEEPLPPGAPA